MNIASILGIILLLFSSGALACSCKGGDPLRSLHKVDIVFHGRAYATEIERDVNGNEIQRTKFRIKVLLQGKHRGMNIELSSSPHSETCGYGFREKVSYLVFASNNRDDQLRTGLCGVYDMRGQRGRYALKRIRKWSR